MIDLAQMRHQDNLCAMLRQIVNRRQSGNDPVIIGNFSIFDRYVKVDANQDAFSFNIKVTNSLFCHVKNSSFYISNYNTRKK